MEKTDISITPIPVKINSPEQLRKLPVSKLPQVCQELRDTLIKHLSVNPGHFASSMGAVDLTVALHYVYNTPYDRIVWDVGHQAYAHKLLTGRRDRFHTNRTFGGLSGFPNPSESEYDTFIAGHASNSISAALGMAVASALKHESPRRHVVAVIGDASISGGLAFEGLNNVANTPNNLLIILNDNEMSIDRNVGQLTSYLSQINTSKRYNRLRYKVYRTLRSMGLVSDRHRGPILRFNNSLKSLLGRRQNIFEGLDIRYFGPVDGNDVEKVVRVLEDIKDMEGPKLLHLRTTKGRGYKPAEEEPHKWHAPGKFNPETGQRNEDKNESRPTRKWQDVFGETLLQIARENDKVVGITAAMSSGTGMSIMQSELPARVFDVGISEGHAVTFAGGLAKDGMHPFVAIYSSFLQRAYDHMIHDVAIQHLPVTFCIDRAGVVGEDGVTHHGAFDLAYLRSIPGMSIASPSDAAMLRNLMFTSLTFNGPLALRYPRGKAIAATDEVMAAPMTWMEPGCGRQLAQGSKVVFLSIGPIAAEVSKAVELLKDEGVDAAHYDMIWLYPLDTSIVDAVGRMNCPILTVEDGVMDGGLGSAVMERLNDMGYNGRQVTRIGMPSHTFVEHGSIAELYKICEMDASSIAKAALRAINSHSMPAVQ